VFRDGFQVCTPVTSYRSLLAVKRLCVAKTLKLRQQVCALLLNRKPELSNHLVSTDWLSKLAYFVDLFSKVMNKTSAYKVGTKTFLHM
jgi:hypothetical protein